MPDRVSIIVEKNLGAGWETAMQYFAFGLAGVYGLAILAAVVVNALEPLRFWLATPRRGKRARVVVRQDKEAANDPQIIIVLVHGTWAKSASWTAPQSLLRSSLSSALDNRALFESFSWSGGNSIRARRTSAALLREKLTTLLTRYPGAQTFVIGHSHGGSITLDALDQDIAGKIGGIVCLATPVLTTRRRQCDPLARIALWVIPVVPMVGLGQWFIERFGIKDDGDSPVWLLFIAAGFLISWLAYRWAKTIDSANDLSYLDRAKIIFLRVPGDEASALLSTAHLLSWAMGKISTGPTRMLWHEQFAE